MNYKNPSLVEEIEREYPEMTKEFKDIMFRQYELFCMKQSNYGPGNIAVGTSLQTHDKIQRLKQLVVLSKEDNVNESIEDTLQDLSVYGIIAQIVSNGKWAK